MSRTTNVPTPVPDDVEDLTSSVLVRRYGDTVVIGTPDPVTLTGRQAVQLCEVVLRTGSDFLIVGQLGMLAVLDFGSEPPLDPGEANGETLDSSGSKVRAALDSSGSKPARPPANRQQYECTCGWACVDDTGDAAGFNEAVDEHLDGHEGMNSSSSDEENLSKPDQT